MVLMWVVSVGSGVRPPTREPATMSILNHSPSPQDAEARQPSGRLSVITAGSLGNVEARLGASGFDIVAVAETEDALVDAVAAEEPDAIVVEAGLCSSLEHVRDLAPDAVLIAVGDHTPAGALGRIERGVSGTVMAGLLHALVAEGVGGAVAWGLGPALRQGATLNAFQGLGGSLLSTKADLVREHLVNAFRNHAELVALATTVAVTASASLVLTMSAPSADERPARVPPSAPTVESPPQEGTTQHPVPTVFSAPAAAPSGIEGDAGDRRGQDGGESKDHGGHDDQGDNGNDPGENGNDPGENGNDPGENGNDQGENGNDQGENGNDQGENGNDQGRQGSDQGRQGTDQGGNGNDQGQQGTDQGGDGVSQGENGNDQGADNDDQA